MSWIYGDVTQTHHGDETTTNSIRIDDAYIAGVKVYGSERKAEVYITTHDKPFLVVDGTPFTRLCSQKIEMADGVVFHYRPEAVVAQVGGNPEYLILAPFTRIDLPDVVEER